MTRTNDAKFLFDSASTPGLVHTVQYVETEAGWALACDCLGAQYGRTCWHLRAARDAERKPAPVVALVAPLAVPEPLVAPDRQADWFRAQRARASA